MENTQAPIALTAPFNGNRPDHSGGAPPGGDTPLVDLWDEERLAAYLGVGQRFVRRLCEEGRIRYILIARHRRFDPADVTRYIEAEKRGVEDAAVKHAAPRRRGRPIGSGRVAASGSR